MSNGGIRDRKRSRRRFWKVELQVAIRSKDMDGDMKLRRQTSFFNVKAKSRVMAEMLVGGDVPEDVIIEKLEAIPSSLRKFRGIVDYDDGSAE